MRLLQLSTEGTLSFEDFDDVSTPAYAILSHTWGANRDEVILEDVIKGTAQSKPGFHKVRFCGRQAAKDGLEYFWVDTCCIDKTSSAELSEAINSMFKWYRRAAKCYVYLSDISMGTPDSTENGPDDLRLLHFKESRWFTRGWTLQELIAPALVEFFSMEGELLGDKASLEHLIHQTTGIPVEALRGDSLSNFHVRERFSWAESRKTKREEDAAYSLLGMFGIHMPLIYGEGRHNAMRRLRKYIEDEESFRSPDSLRNGQELKRNQSLVSEDRRYYVTFQEDGNFVLSGPSGTLWASNTSGITNARNVIMQRDGNLVMYTEENKAVWASHTNGRPRTKFIVQNDGNAIIYSDKIAVWATHTIGGKRPECLERDQKLLKGQSLVSRSELYNITFQNDGNLVFGGPEGILWASNTWGNLDAAHVIMQVDGNLVMYTEAGRAIWASQTAGYRMAQFTIQDDGNAIVYADRVPVWATRSQ